MKTLRLQVDPADLHSPRSSASIEQAASILQNGGLVAFPTETVYGLGADALNPKAVAGIFEAKQRPAWDPVIVHIADLAMLPALLAATPLSPCAQSLIDAYWPGPLTLLLLRSQAIPDIVTAGRALVGVRMPASPVARALIKASGLPIAAPSANSFGRISPTTAAHVLEDLDGRIDAVLDAGETAHGVESTVVDASGERVVVYRPGVVTLRQIQAVCPSARFAEAVPPSTSATPESLPSPGFGIRHYAPRAQLILIEGTRNRQSAKLIAAARDASRDHRRIGVMLPANFVNVSEFELLRDVVLYHWGDWDNLPELAHRLFAGLRQLDAEVDVILCPLPGVTGIGAALQDRLRKAARSTR
jgi:L-threonylcarbamoyladenylate synthase